MATHSSVLAWRIPGTEEPSGLPSMGSQSRTRLKRCTSSLLLTSIRFADDSWIFVIRLNANPLNSYSLPQEFRYIRTVCPSLKS